MYWAKVLPSDSRQSPSPSELATESTGCNVATGTQVWLQPIAENSITLARTRSIPNDIVSLTHVEQAEAGQSRLVQQTALQILAFQHCELLGRHLAAVGPKLRIELAAGGEEVFFGLDAFDGRDQLLLDRRQALFQLFQIAIVLF